MIDEDGVEVGSRAWEPANEQEEATRRKRRRQITAGVLLALIAVLIAGAVAKAGVEAQIDARIRAAGAGANSGLVAIESEQLSLLRAMTFTNGVAAAIKAESSTELNRLTTPLQVNSGVPMVDIVLHDGQVVLAIRSKGAPRPVASRHGLAALSESFARSRGVRGGRFSEIVTLQNSPTLLTIGPVIYGNEKVGAILVMTPLADVLGRLSSEVRATLSSYNSYGLPIVTTSPTRPQALAPFTASMLLQNGHVIFRGVPDSNREAVGRLIVDHHAATLLGVSVPDDSLLTEILVDLIGITGLLAGLFIGWPVARRRQREAQNENLGTA
jgi:hypothetical protein